MAVLEQDMGPEALRCPILHNMVVLVWEMDKSNHTTEEVLMAYTSEVKKKGKSQ